MSAFRRGHQPRPSDVFVLVMGMTGAGKSSFISLCTEDPVVVGHGLQGCTERVEEHVCRYSPSVNIYLIDTPGFDDTTRSDTDVLKEVACWLTSSYSNKVKLNGILYLHRITDLRMQGSAIMNLVMFKKLCGRDALKNVTLVTTMWEKVDADDGERREQELRTTPDYWGWMLAQGSLMARHNNTRDSAMCLLERFVKQPGATLSIQREMVFGKKNLNDTEAGKKLSGDKAKYEEWLKKELKKIKNETQEALKDRDKEAARALCQHEAIMNKKLERVRKEKKGLEISMQRLHAEKAKEVEYLRARNTHLEQGLQEAHSENRKLKKDMNERFAGLEEALASTKLQAASSSPSSSIVAAPPSSTWENLVLSLRGGAYYTMDFSDQFVFWIDGKARFTGQAEIRLLDEDLEYYDPANVCVVKRGEYTRYKVGTKGRQYDLCAQPMKYVAQKQDDLSAQEQDNEPCKIFWGPAQIWRVPRLGMYTVV